MKNLVGYTQTKRVEEVLEGSEEKYRSLINNVRLGIFRSTPGSRGRFLEVNPAMEEITGYSREELLQMDVSSLYVKPEERVAVLEKMALTNGRTTMELNYRKKDGTRIVVSDTKVPVRDSTGKIIYFDGILEDITERKKSEDSLRQAHDYIDRILNSMYEAVMVMDLNHNITDVNSCFIKHYNNSHENIIGRKCYEVTHHLSQPCSRAQDSCPMQKVIKTKNVTRVEHTHKDSNGQDLVMEISCFPLLGSDGIIENIVEVQHDITERKQAEEVLRFSDAAFRSIQESVIATDMEYAITHWNKVSEQIYGVKASEAIGKKLFDVIEIVETSPDKNAKRFKKLEAKDYYQEEQLHRTKNAEVWVSVSIQAIKSNRKRYGWVALTTDITERRKAEEEKKQLQQELDVSSRLALIGEMASGIAHEINNPLTGVIGFAQLLMNRDVPDDIKEGLGVINSEAQRVAKIVSGLLTFAHQHKPGQESVDVNELILEILKLRSYEMEVHNIKVTNQLAPDLPSTIADGSQLQQVFLNIIINAEQIMIEAHGGGKLYVKTERLNDSIRISFNDDGPGISKENLNKIFNPFFTTKGVGKGTGLGLSVCHGIVTRHKGKIYAESEPGKGATFVVELSAAADAKQEGKLEINGIEPSNREGTTILVVDDEKAILAFLNHLLSEWGYEVKTVDNASDALDRIKNEGYSVILLDINMPNMSGIELYQHIKDIRTALVRRVIFITGDVMEETTNDFLMKNEVPNIAKPIDIDKLNENINHILTRELAQAKAR